MAADIGDAAGEGHARQTSATIERIAADFGDAAGESHARQTTAPREHPVADCGDAAGESHARKIAATRKRSISDFSHRYLIDSGWDDQDAGGFWVGTDDCQSCFIFCGLEFHEFKYLQF